MRKLKLTPGSLPAGTSPFEPASVIATWHRLMRMARPYQPGALGNSRPGRTRSSVRKKAAAIRVQIVGRAMVKPKVTLKSPDQRIKLRSRFSLAAKA